MAHISTLPILGLAFLFACSVDPSEIVDTGESDAFWNSNESSNNEVDFAFCNAAYLIVREDLDIRFEHSNQKKLCFVPKGGAVSSRQLIEGETIPDRSIWLPVRFELCTGWVESSKLRCPEGEEKSTWVYLSVPYHNQLRETDSTRWSPYSTCMATALTMLFDYYQLEDDVNVVNAFADEIDPSDGGYDPGCSANPVCASAGAAVQIAETYCTSVSAGDGWRREDLIDALDNANPVFALVTGGLVPGGFGHGIVIVGYLDEGDRFIYHDPMVENDDLLEKGNSITRWEVLKESWKGPIDVGDPLQPEGHSFFGLNCSE